jgi:hypothetical protein
MEIVDAHGNVLMHIKPQKKPVKPELYNEYRGPGPGGGVTNNSGINRVVWNFRTDAPRLCTSCAKEFQGARVGPQVPPGRYGARIALNGRTYTQWFEVKPDPRNTYTQAQLQAAYDFARKYSDISGKINAVLDDLAAQEKSLADAQSKIGGNAALSARVKAAMAQRDALFHTFTANYKNGEDSIQWPGELREDLPRGGYGAASPPTPSLLEYAKRWDSAYAAAMAKYNAYVADTLKPLSVALSSAGAGSIQGDSQVR